MLRIMLVDDEKLGRDRLRRMLDTAEFEVVAEATNGREALERAQEHKPDIVLLDIRMPGMDGLEAARHMAQMQQPPAVVFCTAYDEYAIAAFDVQAVGYVLKPVTKNQLESALDRAGRLSSAQLSAIALEGAARSHLLVKTHLGIELIPVEKISHFMADQKYVTAYLDGREWVIDDSLKQLEVEFSEQLLRIHRNTLVAVATIEGLLRTKTGKSEIKLRNLDSGLPVSRRHLADVKKALGKL